MVQYFFFFYFSALELYKEFQEESYSVALHPSGLFILVGFADKLRLLNLLIDDIRTFKEFTVRSCREVRPHRPASTNTHCTCTEWIRQALILQTQSKYSRLNCRCEHAADIKYETSSLCCNNDRSLYFKILRHTSIQKLNEQIKLMFCMI